MPAASCGLPPTRGTSTRNQGPPSPRSSRLAWPPEPYLVVELPPAPETQLQEFTCVPLDDFQADSAKRKPGSRGLECRCRGWNSSSQIAQGSDRPLIPSYTPLLPIPQRKSPITLCILSICHLWSPPLCPWHLHWTVIYRSLLCAEALGWVGLLSYPPLLTGVPAFSWGRRAPSGYQEPIIVVIRSLLLLLLILRPQRPRVNQRPSRGAQAIF